MTGSTEESESFGSMKKFWCGSNFGLQTSWSSRSFFFPLYKPIVLRCSGYEKWWQQKKIKGNLYGFIDVKSITVYSPSHIVELIYCFKCYFVPSFLVGISRRFNAICGPSKIASLSCLHSCSTHTQENSWFYNTMLGSWASLSSFPLLSRDKFQEL